MEKIPIIAVVGPTASGKTALAVALAQHYDAEVLSFDSMQLYRGMDIATAKPTTEEMQGIPHHMIDCVDPEEIYSVAKYKDAANQIIDDIISRGKRVVMVGGTGLYLDTLIENISFQESEVDMTVRDELAAELATTSPEHMWQKLQEVDPASAASLHPNNTGRVLRALEIYYSTGKTMSYQVENSHSAPSRFAPVYIGLNARDRGYLYDRIDRRVDEMLERGLLDEVSAYVASDVGATAKQAIGLKELAPYVMGEESLDACVARLKQGTRNYAKRQLTWFRRNEAIHWFYIDEMDFDTILSSAISIIDKEGGSYER